MAKKLIVMAIVAAALCVLVMQKRHAKIDVEMESEPQGNDIEAAIEDALGEEAKV